MSAHILLVEDDDMTRFVLAEILKNAGYAVLPAANGTVAIELLEQHTFDVVVTDIRMREIDGIAILNAARGQRDAPEVILLTGYASVETAVAALRAGAFNYLFKPCDANELLGCVTTALKSKQTARRQREAMRIIAEEYAQIADSAGSQSAGPSVASSAGELPAAHSRDQLVIGALRLDLKSHMATFDGQILHLTPTEFAILCCLAEVPGQVLAASEIVRRTHGYDTTNTEARNLLHAHMRNLRRKIPPAYLVTVRSIGYLLADPADQNMELESDE